MRARIALCLLLAVLFTLPVPVAAQYGKGTDFKALPFPPAAWDWGQALVQEPAQALAAPAPAARVWLGPDGQPLPFKSDEEVMEFLRTAKVMKMQDIPRGVTSPRQVLLEKDGIRARAAWRTFNEEKDMARMATGKVEMFFRDSYIFEPAAYELSRLLGLDNVPPAITRKIYGEAGSLQIWVEKAMIEQERQRDKITPPDVQRWNRQVQIMRVFDNLIYNTDRNMGNIIIDQQWKLWMIDHSRAFRRFADLNNPQGIIQCERKLWEKLRALDPNETKVRLKPYLRKIEIDAILDRRKKLVALVEKLIQERGEDQVLFDLN